LEEEEEEEEENKKCFIYILVKSHRVPTTLTFTLSLHEYFHGRN
jgi:hypothetical protein